MKILIIDDEPDLCWALDRMIRSNDMQISTASCGAEALDLVEAHIYTVAFIDAILPDTNGLQLAQRVHARSPDTAIVMMSGYYYQDDLSITQSHIVGFLAKPFLISDVRTTLQHAVRLARGSQGEASAAYATHTTR
jgi:DNA-binding NtrC family response regulator